MAAAESEAVHAFRDASEAGRTALDLWPEGEDDAPRRDALERYACCAELAGELADATRAWRELTDLREGAAYAAALRAELGRHLRHTTLLARLTARPALVDAGVGAAARSPRAMDALVGLGLGRGLITPALAGGLVRQLLPG